MMNIPTSRGEAGVEPALSFSGVNLSPQKEMVRVFYKEMWGRADKSLIPTIFHEGFTFRRSLGPVLRGHQEFARYVDWVTGGAQKGKLQDGQSSRPDHPAHAPRPRR